MKRRYLSIAFSAIFLMLLYSCSDEILNTVIDIDGNLYHTVKIGTQTWMVENLKTTRLNDGTNIPNVTDSAVWSNIITPSYCWYNNDSTYKKTYGALYNWYTVNTDKLAPIGWHVPSYDEWWTLIEYLSDHGYSYDGTIGYNPRYEVNKIAKSMASKVGWIPDSGLGVIGNDLTKNNASGFTGFPAGLLRDWGDFGCEFKDAGVSANWWSTTENYPGAAFVFVLENSAYYAYCYINGLSFGYSVRCIKD